MGIPTVDISEKGRFQLAKSSAILNCVCIPLSLMLLSVGAYIQVAIQSKINLIEGYNGNILPSLFIVLGFLNAIANILGSKACWANSVVEKRALWSKYLLPYIVCTCVISTCVFICGVLCFAQIAVLREAFDAGIMSAMKAYKSDPRQKAELDFLQMEYSCCGSTSYTDWFQIPWVHIDYLNVAKKNLLRNVDDAVYLNDDTPFSCCNPEALRECIHHHVHDNDMHFNYDFRSAITVHTTGCQDSLMEYYGKKLLTNVGAVVLSIWFVQACVVIIVRFLQTSIVAAADMDDPEDPAPGYLFPCGKIALKAVDKATEGIKKLHKGDKGEGSSEEDLAAMKPLLSDDVDDEIHSCDFDSFDDDSADDIYEKPVVEGTGATDQVNFNQTSSKQFADPDYPNFPPPPPPPQTNQSKFRQRSSQQFVDQGNFRQRSSQQFVDHGNDNARPNVIPTAPPPPPLPQTKGANFEQNFSQEFPDYDLATARSLLPPPPSASSSNYPPQIRSNYSAHTPSNYPVHNSYSTPTNQTRTHSNYSVQNVPNYPAPAHVAPRIASHYVNEMTEF